MQRLSTATLRAARTAAARSPAGALGSIRTKTYSMSDRERALENMFFNKEEEVCFSCRDIVLSCVFFLQ